MRVRNESACSIRRDVLMSAADVDTLAKGWLAIDYVDSTRAMIEVAAAHFLFLPTFRRLSTPLLCLDLHLFFARLELGHGCPYPEGTPADSHHRISQKRCKRRGCVPPFSSSEGRTCFMCKPTTDSRAGGLLLGAWLCAVIPGVDDFQPSMSNASIRIWPASSLFLC